MGSKVYEQCINIATTAAGLALTGAKSAAAKTVNTAFFHLNGKQFYVTASSVPLTTDYLGNAITIEDQMQCTLTVRTNIAGTISVAKGIEHTKSEHYMTDLIVNDSPTYAVLGYIYIKNETWVQWVGGTTALDATNTTVTYADAASMLGK